MISATTARKELRNLSKKRAEHNREIAAIDELESALNVILGHADRGSGNTGKRSGKKGAAKPALAKVAFDVLRKEKTPLHINDLWAKIEAAGVVSNAKDPLAVLSIMLARNSGKGKDKRFKKTKRATWTVKR